MYAITGATGHTGKRIAETLLAEEQEVRCIGRDAERLRPLKDRGAEIAVGDMQDEGFLSKAFDGVQAVYALIPPNVQAKDLRGYQNEIGETTAKALVSAGVKHVVNLSSLGAELPDKTGPIKGLHDQEERLDKLTGVRILHLRATYFLENMMVFIPMVKKMGVAASAIRADVPVPMIAACDVANEASERLLKLDFKGHTVKMLLGQRHLTMTGAAEILGKAAGIEKLKYVELPYEEAEKAMRRMGTSEDVARSYVEMQKCINDRIAISNAVRTPENTTKTPIEEFAGAWAAAFKGA